MYSGGEVDRDAGTAFMYVTVEELKTVSSPVGRGLSTTTTRVVRDQKYWLNKSEPEEEEIYKHLPESWLAASGKAQPPEVDEFGDVLMTTNFTNPLYTGEIVEPMAFGNPLYNGENPQESIRVSRPPSAVPGLRHRIGRRQRAPATNASDEEKSFMTAYSIYMNSST